MLLIVWNFFSFLFISNLKIENMIPKLYCSLESFMSTFEEMMEFNKVDDRISQPSSYNDRKNILDPISRDLKSVSRMCCISDSPSLHPDEPTSVSTSNRIDSSWKVDASSGVHANDGQDQRSVQRENEIMHFRPGKYLPRNSNMPPNFFSLRCVQL